ncbi:hypothetical protein PR048_019709 [Dryococelus australis]|uniref:Uncharacterized protein n=1 Tax=Dryococelus australis TaxID=614101 RepID=A0ABQ9H487_9NEOP|nr:hypothetical protein PR048_019709 [Dryococelus australis]
MAQEANTLGVLSRRQKVKSGAGFYCATCSFLGNCALSTRLPFHLAAVFASPFPECSCACSRTALRYFRHTPSTPRSVLFLSKNLLVASGIGSAFSFTARQMGRVLCARKVATILHIAVSSAKGALCGGNFLAVSLLASHQGYPGSIPGRVNPDFSRVGIVPDDAAGRRVFSRGSPVSPAISPPPIPELPHTHPNHLHTTPWKVSSKAEILAYMTEGADWRPTLGRDVMICGPISACDLSQRNNRSLRNWRKKATAARNLANETQEEDFLDLEFDVKSTFGLPEQTDLRPRVEPRVFSREVWNNVLISLRCPVRAAVAEGVRIDYAGATPRLAIDGGSSRTSPHTERGSVCGERGRIHPLGINPTAMLKRGTQSSRDIAMRFVFRFAGGLPMLISRVRGGARGGAVVRPLASHQDESDSIYGGVDTNIRICERYLTLSLKAVDNKPSRSSQTNEGTDGGKWRYSYHRSEEHFLCLLTLLLSSRSGSQNVFLMMAHTTIVHSKFSNQKPSNRKRECDQVRHGRRSGLSVRLSKTSRRLLVDDVADTTDDRYVFSGDFSFPYKSVIPLPGMPP